MNVGVNCMACVSVLIVCHNGYHEGGDEFKSKSS